MASEANDREGLPDLFETPEELPTSLQALIHQYSDMLEHSGRNGYEVCKEFLNAVEAQGYTFEFGLDGQPFNLTQKEPQTTETTDIGNSDELEDDDEYLSPS